MDARPNVEAAAILDAAKRLAELLSGSSLYREYRRSRLRVVEKPDLALNMRAYKKAQAAYEYKRLLGEPPVFDEEKHLGHLRAELFLNPDARAFLENENALLTVYGQAVELLESACDIEIYGPD